MRDIAALISAQQNPHICQLYVMKALNLSGNAHVCEFTRYCRAGPAGCIDTKPYLGGCPNAK